MPSSITTSTGASSPRPASRRSSWTFRSAGAAALLGALALGAGVVVAAPEDPELAPPDARPVPDEAPPPPPAQNGEAAEPRVIQRGEQEAIEPEVTIIQRGGETVEEYRINGQVYMIKVTPAKGYPYYLMDSDGDGSLDARRDELDPKVLVPRWILFQW